MGLFRSPARTPQLWHGRLARGAISKTLHGRGTRATASIADVRTKRSPKSLSGRWLSPAAISALGNGGKFWEIERADPSRRLHERAIHFSKNSGADNLRQ
jgi:hypothetical protein